MHLCIARCQFELKDFRSCIVTLKRAIRLSPNDLHLWSVTRFFDPDVPCLGYHAGPFLPDARACCHPFHPSTS